MEQAQQRFDVILLTINTAIADTQAQIERQRVEVLNARVAAANRLFTGIVALTGNDRQRRVDLLGHLRTLLTAPEGDDAIRVAQDALNIGLHNNIVDNYQEDVHRVAVHI